jgi:hypothetical protein
MADVDSVEICRNKGCWKPLAIIEHLYDTGSDKKKYTNIVEQIGKGLNIPVYLVYYKEVEDDTLSFRVAQKYPISGPLKAMSEQEWVGTLFHLQAEHQKICKFKK